MYFKGNQDGIGPFPTFSIVNEILLPRIFICSGFLHILSEIVKQRLGEKLLNDSRK
jgi:hypothetical protein